MSNNEPLDFSLFGDVIIKPSTGQKEDPKKVLVGKIVSRTHNTLTLQYQYALACLSLQISLLFSILSGYLAARFYFTSELIGGNVSDPNDNRAYRLAVIEKT